MNLQFKGIFILISVFTSGFASAQNLLSRELFQIDALLPKISCHSQAGIYSGFQTPAFDITIFGVGRGINGGLGAVQLDEVRDPQTTPIDADSRALQEGTMYSGEVITIEPAAFSGAGGYGITLNVENKKANYPRPPTILIKRAQSGKKTEGIYGAQPKQSNISLDCVILK